MHPSIQIVHDRERGCGWRKTGGLYLVGDGLAVACGRLPIPLTVCPCCGHGFKPTRGWTWVDADRIIEAAGTGECNTGNCQYCPLGRMIIDGLGHAGMLWVGEEFYKTPLAFSLEAQTHGTVSRRIPAVPNDFVVGETWVLLAHRKAIPHPLEIGKEPTFTAGIFRIWKPQRIEVICDGTESDEVIESYLARGLTPVMVERITEPVPVQEEMLR